MFANYFSFIPRLLPAWMLPAWMSPARLPLRSFLKSGLLLSGLLLSSSMTPANAAENTSTMHSPGVIVVGFVGGFVRSNDTVHQEVQLAAHLRNQYPARMQVKIFENRQGREAHREVLEMLDA